MSNSSNNDGFEKDHLKAMEVCGRVIEICHSRVFSTVGPINFDELKKITSCLMDAWMMSGSRASGFGDEEKMEGFSNDDEEEEDDGPPHPLK